MKMRVDENIARYVERIKASANAIKASEGKIEDVTVVRKVLRTLLPIYIVIVSSIQEMRCDPNNKRNLDVVAGRLIAFELDNYDNYTPSSSDLESKFESKLSLKKKAKNSKRKKI